MGRSKVEKRSVFMAILTQKALMPKTTAEYTNDYKYIEDRKVAEAYARRAGIRV